MPCLLPPLATVLFFAIAVQMVRAAQDCGWFLLRSRVLYALLRTPTITRTGTIAIAVHTLPLFAVKLPWCCCRLFV